MSVRPPLQQAVGFLGQPRLWLVAVIQHFRGEDIRLRASGLTYITIFSIVPLMTVGLTLLTSIHQLDWHDRLHGLMADLLAPGVREDSSEWLESFLRLAASRGVSGVSLAALALTGGSLLKNLDASLNELWNVQETRSWAVRALLYLLAMTVGPVLLGLSLVGTSQLRVLLAPHLPGAMLPVLAVVAPVVALGLLYGFAPNAPVRFRPAATGALIAGLTWSLAKVAYATFAARVFRYNLVYGSLSAAPLFLVWVWLSWLIVLFGARLSFALQHAAYRKTWPLYALHPRGRELLAARVAVEFARAYRERTGPLSLDSLTRRVRVPPDILAPVLRGLRRAGLLSQVGHHLYSPARDPSQLSLGEACSAVRGAAIAPRLKPLLREIPELAPIERLLTEADEATASALRKLSWNQLLEDASQVSNLPSEGVGQGNL